MEEIPTTEHAIAAKAEPPESEVRSGVKLPPKVSRLRWKLGQKAKQEPTFRFYALYDRICRDDVLTAAWWLVMEHNGAAGVDGVRIQDIIDGPGAAAYLKDLREELVAKRYRPQPVKRVHIPKPDGRLRPLGIPTVRDRIVQTAVLLVLEPIFEADFLDASYGFRPGRRAHQALDQIQHYLERGFRQVYDADLQGYFDSIPHDKLMAALRMRVVDRSVLRLIRMWLEAPVVEWEKGQRKVTRNRQGTPQGGVISPLLANVYLHWFDYLFHREDGPACWANAKLIRYADDFVILARYQTRRLVGWVESTLEGRFGLTINREKTRVVNLAEPRASVNFLGFTFRYDRNVWQKLPNGRRILRRAGPHEAARPYLNVFPSDQALGRLRAKIRQLTGTSRCMVPVTEVIGDTNRVLGGWQNYFAYGHPRVAFRKVNWYVTRSLVRHLRRRSQRPFRPPKGVSYLTQLRRLGLRLLERTADSPAHARG